MNRKLRITILKRFDTQWEFSQAVNEHESKVSQVIRGRRKLTREQAKVWAKVLKCDMAVFQSVTKET